MPLAPESTVDNVFMLRSACARPYGGINDSGDAT